MVNLRYENISISIHKAPCNPCPFNKHYAVHAREKADRVTESIHIPCIDGGYITIEQTHEYMDWIKAHSRKPLPPLGEKDDN